MERGSRRCLKVTMVEGKWTVRALHRCYRAGRTSPRPGPRESVYSVLSGMYPWIDVLYEGDRSGYLTEKVREVWGYELNGSTRGLLSDKLRFEEALSGSVARLPQFLGFVEGGSLEQSKFRTMLELVASVVHGSGIVARPRFGSKGRGVEVFRCEDGQYIGSRGSVWNVEDLASHIELLSGYVLTEFVWPHEYARSIFDESANTMRLMTFCGGDGTPFLGAGVHRFGRFRSDGMDNFSAGGLSVAIDLGDGILGKGVFKDEDGTLSWSECHPDSGVRISGTEVPFWDECVNSVLDAHRLVGAKWVGWDVLVGEDGPFLIEGNNCPDVDLVQVHRGLLENAYVKAFWLRELRRLRG